MTLFLENLLLALIWSAAMTSFDRENMIVGFILGYLVLWLVRPTLSDTRYLDKVRQSLGFVWFFFVELVKANVQMTRYIFSPASTRRPAVIAVPIDAETDAEITLLANLITLTPGTLSLDVSEDRKVLYVHTMHLDEAETFRAEIKEGFERRVLELLR